MLRVKAVYSFLFYQWGDYYEDLFLSLSFLLSSLLSSLLWHWPCHCNHHHICNQSITLFCPHYFLTERSHDFLQGLLSRIGNKLIWRFWDAGRVTVSRLAGKFSFENTRIFTRYCHSPPHPSGILHSFYPFHSQYHHKWKWQGKSSKIILLRLSLKEMPWLSPRSANKIKQDVLWYCTKSCCKSSG